MKTNVPPKIVVLNSRIVSTSLEHSNVNAELGSLEMVSPVMTSTSVSPTTVTVTHWQSVRILLVDMFALVISGSTAPGKNAATLTNVTLVPANATSLGQTVPTRLVDFGVIVSQIIIRTATDTVSTQTSVNSAPMTVLSTPIVSTKMMDSIAAVKTDTNHMAKSVWTSTSVKRTGVGVIHSPLVTIPREVTSVHAVKGTLVTELHVQT